MRLAVATIACAVLLAGCGDRTLAGGPTATAERDDVRLRMELDRAEIRPGDLVWVSLTIENTTDREVRWVAPGCKVPGNVEAAPKQDGAGRQWPGVLGTFKQWLLQETLPPRGTLRSRWAWDGQLRGGIAPPRPAAGGPIDVSASIALGDTDTSVPLRATAPLRVRDGGDGLISAGAAVDAAYEDRRLARWLEARPAPSSSGTFLAGDVVGSARLDGDVWLIHAAQKSGATAPAIAVRSYEVDVRVSARDGKILSVIER